MTRTQILGTVMCCLLTCSGCGSGGFRDFSSPEGKFKVRIPGKPKEKTETWRYDEGGGKKPTELTVKYYEVAEKLGAYAAGFADPPVLGPEVGAANTQAALDIAFKGLVEAGALRVTGVPTRITVPVGDKKAPGIEYLADAPDKEYLEAKKVYDAAAEAAKNAAPGSAERKNADELRKKMNEKSGLDKEGRIARGKLILVGNRLYHITVKGTQDFAKNSPLANKFLDSLEITP